MMTDVNYFKFLIDHMRQHLKIVKISLKPKTIIENELNS